MKKIVKLTESDLIKIVKRIIKENEEEDDDLKPRYDEYYRSIGSSHSDDEIFGDDERAISFSKSSKERTYKILNRYFRPNYTQFVYIGNSEGIDFRDFPEFCESKKLLLLNLKNTPNNFNEVCDGYSNGDSKNNVDKDFWVFYNNQ